MAPRPVVRRERNNDFSAVGKVGRRTGITVPQGRLDENGLEEMSGLFSSPRKPSPLRRQVNHLNGINENSMLEVSEAMTGMDSTGLTPTQVLSTRKSLRGASIPPPRSSSPRKTGISGLARRSNGVDVLSLAKDLPAIDPEDRENTPVLTPSRPAQGQVRRFSPSPDKPPLREVTTNGPAPSRSATGKGRAAEPPPPSPFDYGLADISTDRVEKGVDEAPEDEYYVEFRPHDDGEEISENGDPGYAAAVRLPEENNDEEMHESIEIDEQEEVLLNPRALDNHGIRKRKSDSLEEEERQVLYEDSPPTQPAKRAKVVKDKQAQTRNSKTVNYGLPLDPDLVPTAQNYRRDHPYGKSKSQNPPLSAQQEAELGQIIDRVRARPGQQRSLYILRRETPADDSAVHTRSGRVSVKPLAYWRNERCVYGGSPGGASLSEGARFPLNSIKEIIRTEEVENSRSRSPSRGKRKGKKSKGKSRSGTVEVDRNCDSDSGVDEEWIDPDAEEWEASSGIYRGDVSIWDQDQEKPLDALEEVELAYAPASIQTKEAKSMHPDQRSFKYAKLLSKGFFGSGIVELAPGDLKRPKSSRKMHMSFFVAKGRVTVQVGPLGGEMNKFSIGKGGFWQVPRGNQYSIENELDKSAKIFFSQASEPAPTRGEE